MNYTLTQIQKKAHAAAAKAQTAWESVEQASTVQRGNPQRLLDRERPEHRNSRSGRLLYLQTRTWTRACYG